MHNFKLVLQYSTNVHIKCIFNRCINPELIRSKPIQANILLAVNKFFGSLLYTSIHTLNLLCDYKQLFDHYRYFLGKPILKNPKFCATVRHSILLCFDCYYNNYYYCLHFGLCIIWRDKLYKVCFSSLVS